MKIDLLSLHEIAFNLNESRRQVERFNGERSDYAASVWLGFRNQLFDAKYLLGRIKNDDNRY